jgi:hypothetical protein
MSADTFVKWYRGCRGRPVPAARGQLDPALVLLAGSMLREQARPVLGVRGDLGAAFACLRNPADLVGWMHLEHRRLAGTDDLRIAVRADDAESVDVPRVRRKAPVAEVEAQEVAIRDLRERQRITAAHGTRRVTQPAGLLGSLEVGTPPGPPVADGAPRDACLTSDFTVAPARPDEFQDEGDFLSGPHLRYPPLASPSGVITAAAMDSKSIARKGVRVRVPPRAPMRGT